MYYARIKSLREPKRRKARRMNVAMFITDRDKDSAVLRGCRDKEGLTKSKAERKGKRIAKIVGFAGG
jgi:hypothetical protein